MILVADHRAVHIAPLGRADEELLPARDGHVAGCAPRLQVPRRANVAPRPSPVPHYGVRKARALAVQPPAGPMAAAHAQAVTGQAPVPGLALVAVGAPPMPREVALAHAGPGARVALGVRRGMERRGEALARLAERAAVRAVPRGGAHARAVPAARVPALPMACAPQPVVGGALHAAVRGGEARGTDAFLGNGGGGVEHGMHGSGHGSSGSGGVAARVMGTQWHTCTNEAFKGMHTPLGSREMGHNQS